jgi:hypothetical protein
MSTDAEFTSRYFTHLTSLTYPEKILRNGQNKGRRKAIERASGIGWYNKGHLLGHEKTGQSHYKALHLMAAAHTVV